MTKSAPQTNTKSLRGLEHCRVVDIGMEQYGECLKEGPSTCAYAVPFGYCFLCGHPRVSEIIASTKEAESFAGASR